MGQDAFISTILEDFLSLIYPNVCINCQKVLYRNENEICISCLAAIPKFSTYPDGCNSLAEKFIFEPKIDQVRAFLVYRTKGIGQKIIHELKYKNNASIGTAISELFANELLLSELSTCYNVVIPIPLHKRKLLIRGYNQAEIISLPISEKLGIPLISDALIRTQFTKTQTKKGKLDRWLNMTNPFEQNMSYDLTNKKVMLVDDVITTGATISAAVDVLIKANVQSVGVFALAAPKK